MKESKKANLIVFFIIAIIAFCISCAFINLTVKEKTDQYKLISIENNSFKPVLIKEVPTIIKTKNVTNTTNSTYNTTNTHSNHTNYHESNYNYSNYYKRNYREYW